MNYKYLFKLKRNCCLKSMKIVLNIKLLSEKVAAITINKYGIWAFQHPFNFFIMKMKKTLEKIFPFIFLREKVEESFMRFLLIMVLFKNFSSHLLHCGKLLHQHFTLFSSKNHTVENFHINFTTPFSNENHTVNNSHINITTLVLHC